MAEERQTYIHGVHGILQARGLARCAHVRHVYGGTRRKGNVMISTLQLLNRIAELP